MGYYTANDPVTACCNGDAKAMLQPDRSLWWEAIQFGDGYCPDDFNPCLL
jgi:hypothetical protein